MTTDIWAILFMKDTRTTLTDREKNTGYMMLRHESNIVLHSIPRDVLVSVVKETVAYDFHSLRQKPKTYYTDRAHGTGR